MAPKDDIARREERESFFDTVARDLFENGVFDGSRIAFRAGRVKPLTTAYFILNDCYKKWRIEDGHFTQEPKIAALKCLAIMTFQPFRPVYLSDVRTVAEAKCNEIYALNCAAAVLGFPIDPDNTVKNDFWYRLLDILSEGGCHTLEPYRVDTNYGISNDLSSGLHPVPKTPSLV